MLPALVETPPALVVILPVLVLMLPALVETPPALVVILPVLVLMLPALVETPPAVLVIALLLVEMLPALLVIAVLLVVILPVLVEISLILVVILPSLMVTLELLSFTLVAMALKFALTSAATAGEPDVKVLGMVTLAAKVVALAVISSIVTLAGIINFFKMLPSFRSNCSMPNYPGPRSWNPSHCYSV